MIYVEIYQVMWHAFAGILAALTLVALLCPVVLVFCELFRSQRSKKENGDTLPERRR